MTARFSEALATLTRALEISQHVPDAPVLPSGPLNALGILAKDLGDYAEAARRYNDALQLLRKNGGRNSAQLAGIHHNLAGLAYAQGFFYQADDPAHEAVRLRRSAVPPDLDGLAADLSVLGSVLAGQERFEEAGLVLSEALAYWRSRYGDSHYEVAVQLNSLAAIYQTRREYSSAEAALDEALAIKRNLLGDHHPEIAVILNNLATVYTDTGRKWAAANCYKEAIEIFSQTLGGNHPSTLICLQNQRGLAE
ncbi:tetratricopeptide (TPR) repeat protein [Arthrobacter sp. AZCC_0090]|nr:tetratricopeptide (TPR) repeat protein [Arthrobacter sp. AZCC_0090]